MSSLWDIETALFTKIPPSSNEISPHLQPEKPKVSQKKPSKWDPPDANFKVDLSIAKAFTDIGNINWTDLQHFKGVERSEKGTEGLFFVEHESGIFIVKRSTSIESEVFCSLLCMRLGLNAPKVRIVSSNSDEGNHLLSCLESIDKSFRVITTLANLSNILLMEFVRGITLNKLTHTTAPEVLKPQALRQLGSLMALDVITNNSDRLPLAWTNEGNLDNIMLSERGATIVPIDSKIIPLEASHPHGDRVKELLQQVLAHPGHESSQFHRIRDLITLYTGHDVGAEGSISMQEGFLATVRECAALDLSAFEKELISWQDALQKHHNLTLSPQAIPFIIRMLQIYHDAIHNPSSLPSTTSKTTTPSIAPSASTSVSSPSHSSSSSSSSSSANPVSSDSLVNITECAWVKVVVPNEKPAPRRYHSGVMYDKKLYVFGGVCVKTPSNDFYVFDFDTKKWAIVVAQGEAPSPRCGHSATVYDGKMWIFGGHDNNRHPNPYDDLYSFDFASLTWAKVEKQDDVWPSPRYHHSATLVGSSLFIFGGAAGKSKYFNETFVYKFETKKWEILKCSGEIPEPRAGIITVEWNNSLFVFGGYGGDGGYTSFLDTHALELGTNTFREVDISGTFPRTARPISYIPYYSGSGANKEGAVFTFGGSDGKDPLGSLFLWNLRTNKWKIIKAWMAMDESATGGSISAVVGGKMDPTPRYGHCTVLDSEGGVLSIFGGSGSLFLDDVVQFDLSE